MPAHWIDTHHHLWRYNESDYPWMSNNMTKLRRDFLTRDLEAVTIPHGVGATVAVQARQQLDETEFLLSTARESTLIQGVVGWVPLIAPDIEDYLDRFAQDPLLKGVRHVLHDEPDPFYMLREDFNTGIAKLAHYNLSYDLLVFARHLPQTIEFVDSHPNQIFILDHIAKPSITGDRLTEWAMGLRSLAERQNVFCKVSGMVTEAEWNSWTEDQLRPYWDVVLSAFGADRLMFGSDWPVLTLASNYEDWLRVVTNWVEELSVDEAEAIRQKTAKKIYRL